MKNRMIQITKNLNQSQSRSRNPNLSQNQSRNLNLSQLLMARI